MSGFPAGLLLELVVVILLVATIAYCAVLDRRLRALRSGADGMKQLVAALDAATVRAVEATTALNRAGGTAGRDLQETVTAAQSLKDELGIMVTAGEGIARRLAERNARSDEHGVDKNVPPTPQSLEERLGDKLRSALKAHH